MAKEINRPLFKNIDGEKVKVNPLTKSECVTMSDGRTVEEVINELRQLILGEQPLQVTAFTDESRIRTMSLEEEVVGGKEVTTKKEVTTTPTKKKRGRKKKEEVTND